MFFFRVKFISMKMELGEVIGLKCFSIGSVSLDQ